MKQWCSLLLLSVAFSMSSGTKENMDLLLEAEETVSQKKEALTHGSEDECLCFFASWDTRGVAVLFCSFHSMSQPHFDCRQNSSLTWAAEVVVSDPGLSLLTEQWVILTNSLSGARGREQMVKEIAECRVQTVSGLNGKEGGKSPQSPGSQLKNTNLPWGNRQKTSWCLNANTAGGQNLNDQDTCHPTQNL